MALFWVTDVPYRVSHTVASTERVRVWNDRLCLILMHGPVRCRTGVESGDKTESCFIIMIKMKWTIFHCLFHHLRLILCLLLRLTTSRVSFDLLGWLCVCMCVCVCMCIHLQGCMSALNLDDRGLIHPTSLSFCRFPCGTVATFSHTLLFFFFLVCTIFLLSLYNAGQFLWSFSPHCILQEKMRN